MEETSLAGKIALITGAACGIGKATALLFAKLGARLVLVDLREADLNATAIECNGISKTPVLSIVADITDDHMVQVIHQKTLDHFGGLDILDTALMSYCVSKAGLDMFTQCAALQLATKGVRVNSIHPGSTNTPILLHSGYSEKKNKDFLEAIKAKHPIGRYAEPIEMARAIAFLASPAASFITATLIPVDGGFTAKCE
ncbi:unnamed protein product, partial [Calicophoron daubneyi]